MLINHALAPPCPSAPPTQLSQSSSFYLPQCPSTFMFSHFRFPLTNASFALSHAFSFSSELDQSNPAEETPEGEEPPPADSENKWVSGQLPSCGFHTCSPGHQDGVAFASKPHLLVSQQRSLSRATIINYCHTLHKVLVTLLRKWFQVRYL